MTAPEELYEDGAWYASSTELQAVVGGSLSTNLPRYRRVLAAATHQIDRWTGRRFLRDTNPSARTVSATVWWRVCVGDFVDPADVVVETDDAGNGSWSTWSADQWRPGVDDDGSGRGVPLDGEPWRWIITTGDRRFPTAGVLDRVRVTTRWGWSEPPQPVVQACLHLAFAHFQGRDRAEQVLDGDPTEKAKSLVVEYAVDGGGLYYQPLVG